MKPSPKNPEIPKHLGHLRPDAVSREGPELKARDRAGESSQESSFLLTAPDEDNEAQRVLPQPT